MHRRCRIAARLLNLRLPERRQTQSWRQRSGAWTHTQQDGTDRFEVRGQIGGAIASCIASASLERFDPTAGQTQPQADAAEVRRGADVMTDFRADDCRGQNAARNRGPEQFSLAPPPAVSPLLCLQSEPIPVAVRSSGGGGRRVCAKCLWRGSDHVCVFPGVGGVVRRVALSCRAGNGPSLLSSTETNICATKHEQRDRTAQALCTNTGKRAEQHIGAVECYRC